MERKNGELFPTKFSGKFKDPNAIRYHFTFLGVALWGSVARKVNIIYSFTRLQAVQENPE